MNNELNTHFLTFEQMHFIGVEIGPTDLYYHLKGGLLIITGKFKEDEEFSIEVEHKKQVIKTQLESFLIDYFSQPGLFMGTPRFELSDIFNKEEFENILQTAIDIIDGKKARANSEDNELLRLFREYNLDPEPTGDNLTNFHAKCPTGRPHQIQISTESNQWGCGYCRVKGGVKELKEVYMRFKK